VAEARREKIFRPRAAYVAERLPALAGETIGDIGAGFGLFLEELRTFWPRASMVAIEPSPQMAAICQSKGFEVVQTAIEELAGQEGRFGLVSAFELLEHLHEPRLLMEKVYRLLRPGGYFLATTLNGEGFDIQVLWENSKSVYPPHHLNFFNPRSLTRLCTEAGAGEKTGAGCSPPDPAVHGSGLDGGRSRHPGQVGLEYCGKCHAPGRGGTRKVLADGGPDGQRHLQGGVAIMDFPALVQFAYAHHCPERLT